MDERNEPGLPKRKNTLWIALAAVAAILLFGWLLSNQFRQRSPLPPPPDAGGAEAVPPPENGPTGMRLETPAGYGWA